MSPKVLISLPVYKREWILPLWLELIEKQDIGLSNIGFQFELGPDDEKTHDVLWEWYDCHTEVISFDGQIDKSTNHKHHLEGQRYWRKEEYLKMVHFRNNLLERAIDRVPAFDYYLSLDSDILLVDPSSISKLISRDKDLVSPLCYMTPHDSKYPNGMNWDGDVGKRVIMKEELQPVDIPMAATLMKASVIKQCRYRWHAQGEDIGFAVSLKANGYKSFIDCDIYAPHIMHRAHLESYLENGDSRGIKSGV
jgi:hypothetical protein